MDLDRFEDKWFPRVYVVLFGLLLLSLLIYGIELRVHAQSAAFTGQPAAPAADYHPSEVQQLRLESRQKDLIITQSQLLDLQHQIDALNKMFKLQLDGLHDAAAEIARENKWPEDTKFSDQYLVFSKPKPSAPAPEAKP